MRSYRLMSRIALLVAVGAASLIACSSDSHKTPDAVEGSGKLSLPLEARSASGNVYRLRNAFFEISNVQTGEFVAFLSSEDDPSASLISTVLNTGDHVITLRPGWFMERIVGSSGGSGGSTASGGFTSFPGGKGGIAGGFNAGGRAEPPKGIDEPFIGGAAGEAAIGGAPSDGGFTGKGGFTNEGGAFPEGGFTSKGGRPGNGDGGTTGGGAVFVDAKLVSNATQFFSIFSRSDSFVFYQFQVGGEVLEPNQGRVHVGIDVFEAEPQCDTPPGTTKTGRVLLETNEAATQQLTLRDVFDAIVRNSGLNGDGETVFRQVFDSYASAENAQEPTAVHCGDEQTNGQPSLNGYRIDCDRFERFHVDTLDTFFATAFVNRIDLAPENGANCGQQRVVFATRDPGRAFMILEAQIPNPQPELGIKGCIPLAQFWAAQNNIDSPFERGSRLTEAYLFGSPELAASGFGPFHTAQNFTIGSGQIRTNQFESDPWTLREFKLVLDDGVVKSIPFPVAESPNGDLWDDTIDTPHGEACRENFLGAVDGLLTDDLEKMSFIVAQECKNAESRDDFSEFYPNRLSDNFRQKLDAKLEGTGLNATDIANRALFAGSCIGCHNEASGARLGRGISAPFSFDFPHITEFTSECLEEPGQSCFPTSEALQMAFLPSRLQTLASFGIPIVPDPCNNNGSGGGTGVGGAPSSGGRVGTAGAAVGGAPVMGPPRGGEAEPAPKIEITLPSASTPVSELLEEDARIRALSGKRTIGGRSAQSTH